MMMPGWTATNTAHGERYTQEVGPYVMSVYRSGSAYRWCVTLINSELTGMAGTPSEGACSAKMALRTHLKLLIDQITDL